MTRHYEVSAGGKGYKTVMAPADPIRAANEMIGARISAAMHGAKADVLSYPQEAGPADAPCPIPTPVRADREHSLHTGEVVGSIPTAPTISRDFLGSIRQLTTERNEKTTLRSGENPGTLFVLCFKKVRLTSPSIFSLQLLIQTITPPHSYPAKLRYRLRSCDGVMLLDGWPASGSDSARSLPFSLPSRPSHHLQLPREVTVATAGRCDGCMFLGGLPSSKGKQTAALPPYGSFGD